jgi:hypothetical protein
MALNGLLQGSAELVNVQAGLVKDGVQ